MWPPPGELTAEGLPDKDEDDILHLVDQEVTKVEHEKINLVNQTDSAPQDNSKHLFALLIQSFTLRFMGKMIP